MLVIKLDNTNIKEEAHLGSEVSLEIAKYEYDYQLQRGSKLESKVGIAFGFCGLYSTHLLKYLDWSRLYFVDQLEYLEILKNFIKFICVIFLLSPAVPFCISSYLLLSLLVPTKQNHFDVALLFDDNITESEPKKASYCILEEYYRLLTENNLNHESRTKKYKNAIHCLSFSLLFSSIIETLTAISKLF